VYTVNIVGLDMNSTSRYHSLIF